jgi:hypothetical protein
MQPISQLVRNVNIESPDLRREKMNGAWVTKFCAVNPCALMFAILWCSWLVMCFLWNLNMCVNKQRFDGDVWHINMRYIYSYIIIYVYIHVCRRMEAVENSPKAYVGFVRVFYAYVLLSSCLLALYVSRTMLSWACARCLTFLASHLPNCWSAALVLKDPSNYKSAYLFFRFLEFCFNIFLWASISFAEDQFTIFLPLSIQSSFGFCAVISMDFLWTFIVFSAVLCRDPEFSC